MGLNQRHKLIYHSINLEKIFQYQLCLLSHQYSKTDYHNIDYQDLHKYNRKLLYLVLTFKLLSRLENCILFYHNLYYWEDNSLI